MTGAECVKDAMVLMGLLDPGASPSTSEQTQALRYINQLIDNLSLERLNIPVIETVTQDLASGTALYTIGPAGSFGPTRPLKIERCKILVPNDGLGSGYLEGPCELISSTQWENIEEKGAKAVRPTALYYDYAYPVGNLNFWPTPTFATITPKAQLYVWQALNSFPDGTTDIDFPQGYDRAIVHLSAVELIAMFSVDPSKIPTLIQNSQQAKAALRAMNAALPGQPPPGGPLDAIPVAQQVAAQ